MNTCYKGIEYTEKEIYLMEVWLTSQGIKGYSTDYYICKYIDLYYEGGINQFINNIKL